MAALEVRRLAGTPAYIQTLNSSGIHCVHNVYICEHDDNVVKILLGHLAILFNEPPRLVEAVGASINVRSAYSQ